MLDDAAYYSHDAKCSSVRYGRNPSVIFYDESVFIVVGSSPLGARDQCRLNA